MLKDNYIKMIDRIAKEVLSNKEEHIFAFTGKLIYHLIDTHYFNIMINYRGDNLDVAQFHEIMMKSQNNFLEAENKGIQRAHDQYEEENKEK